MKKHLVLLLSLFFVPVMYGQKTIENPKIGFTTVSYLNIKKIEITASATEVYFEILNKNLGSFSIPKKTYIKDVASDEKLFIKSAEGVPIGKSFTIPESGAINYKLVFDKLDAKTSKIEYGEANDGGDWFIYDIALQDFPNASGISKELEGNWFNTENANWEIGFYDSNAVYKNKVWQYDAVALKKGNGTVTLSNGSEKIKLFVKKGKSGNYFVGENSKSLISCSNAAANLKTSTVSDNKPFELPILKRDSAIYSGCLKNYSSKLNCKTITIHVDDIIAGNQNTYVGKIDEKGFFSIKLPLYYPHEVWVRSSVFKGSVFLEPGKTVFQLVGDTKTLFMGESAMINTDFEKIKSLIRSQSEYRDLMSKTLDMKPAEYKVYCQTLADKKYKALDSLKKSNVIGAKAYQTGKFEIEYNTISNMLDYKHFFETAFRQKNKIPREQRQVDFKMDTIKADYYDFIKEGTFNNELAVIVNDYKSCINRLQFLDLVNARSVTLTFFDTVEELQKRGYSFTKEEQQLLPDMKQLETLRKTSELKEFNDKYDKVISAFFKKHQKIIKEITNGKSFDFSALEDYLIKNNIPILPEEKEFLAAQKKLEKSEIYKKIKQFDNIDGAYASFDKKHKAIANYLYSEKSTSFRNNKLTELFGLKVGFATDIIASQDICNTVVDQVTPLSEDDLAIAQKKIQTPFIADYLRECNDQTLAKIEANKSKTGYVVNETSKTEADELFASIMKKYKGKVVYVDFWATWCGPCRSGIERIKPLKEEMLGKDVVFVYLTNQTSPEKTYSAMIPDIKGEHYRLSTDEWNYLSGKFNISGIPHYVLVDKKGEVVNPKLGFMSNGEIKKMIEEQMN